MNIVFNKSVVRGAVIRTKFTGTEVCFHLFGGKTELKLYPLKTVSIGESISLLGISDSCDTTSRDEPFIVLLNCMARPVLVEPLRAGL